MLSTSSKKRLEKYLSAYIALPMLEMLMLVLMLYSLFIIDKKLGAWRMLLSLRLEDTKRHNGN